MVLTDVPNRCHTSTNSIQGAEAQQVDEENEPHFGKFEVNYNLIEKSFPQNKTSFPKNWEKNRVWNGSLKWLF